MSLEDIAELKKTKIYRFLKRVFISYTTAVHPIAFVYQTFVAKCMKNVSTERVTIHTIEDYVSVNAYKCQTIEEESVSTVYTAHYWSEQEKKMTLAEKQYMVFPIKCYEINEIEIVGETSFLKKEKNLFVPFCGAISDGRMSFVNKVVRAVNSNMAIIRVKDSKIYCSEAIYCCGEASWNYYHFMVEILPRLILIQEKGLFRELPVMVDAVISKNATLKEALMHVIGDERTIIWVEPCTIYYVNRLVYVSSVVWIPMNVKADTGLIESDYLFSKETLQKTKEYWRKTFSRKSMSEAKYLYVSRKNVNNERMVNAKSVQQICENNGFITIYPERLTLSEQFEYFVNAEVIISCEGAACTNALFCAENTKYFLICPPEHNFLLWSTYMGLLGVNVQLLDAHMTVCYDCASDDQYEADEENLIKLMKELRK